MAHDCGIINSSKGLDELSGGQSAILRVHYRDMLEQYFDGKYYEVSLRKDPTAWTPTRQINITQE